MPLRRAAVRPGAIAPAALRPAAGGPARPGRLARLALALVVLAGRPVAAQEAAPPRMLLVRVVTEAERQPLGYSTVTAAALGLERFTSASGTVALPVPAGRAVTLRVKRLGFSPRDTTVQVGDAPSQEVVVALARVSFRLQEVRVVAWPPCEDPGVGPRTDATVRGVVEQLRENAERYRLLVRQYPFLYTMQREFGVRAEDGSYVAESRDVIPVEGRPEWQYRPGTLVAREPRSTQWVMRIPSLGDLAEDAFVDNHCFHLAGLEEKEGARLLRLDIVAARRLREVDVNVSVWLDPAGYQLRHAEFTLSKAPPQVRGLVSMTSRVRYGEVVPDVPVMQSVHAENVSRSGRGGAARTRVFVERQTLQQVLFRGERPDAPADSLPKPPAAP